MTDKEALKLALDALEESKTNNDTMEFWDRKTKAITACEKALASPVQEPVGNWVWSWLMDWCKRNGIAPATQDSLFAMVKDARNKFATPPAAQPAVPDALTSADIQEHIEYVAGWNDCRAEMLKGMKL
jgi:hypothetical protein